MDDEDGEGEEGKEKGDEEEEDPGVSMWKERGARVCLIMASQLIEMKVRSFRSFILSSRISRRKNQYIGGFIC